MYQSGKNLSQTLCAIKCQIVRETLVTQFECCMQNPCNFVYKYLANSLKYIPIQPIIRGFQGLGPSISCNYSLRILFHNKVVIFCKYFTKISIFSFVILNDIPLESGQIYFNRRRKNHLVVINVSIRHVQGHGLLRGPIASSNAGLMPPTNVFF